MEEHKSITILKQIQEHIGGELLRSRRGVPHLVVDNFYSICYFCKKDNFVVFDNYKRFDKVQTKTLHKTWQETATSIGLLILTSSLKEEQDDGNVLMENS